MAGRKRIFYLDLLRAGAGLWVVASHVFAPICAGMNAYPRSTWWIFNILDSVIRPCAAIFVMISGALYLDSSREESYLQFVRRRCARIVGPFFVWSMIYAYMECHIWEKPFSLSHAFAQFLQGPTEYHLWFMYVILSLYLLTPFLRRFVQAARPAELHVLLLLWGLFLTFEFLAPASFGGAGPGGQLLNYGGYFILGCLLNHAEMPPRRLPGVMLLWLVVVAVNAWATYYLTLWQGGTLNERFYDGATPLVALQAAAVFLIVKHAAERPVFRPLWLQKLVIRLSRESYNVYLMHPFFIWLLTTGCLGFTLSHDTSNPFAGVFLTTATVVAASLALTFLLKKIPIVSKLFVLS